MQEFLITCDEDWSLDYTQWAEVFRPTSLPFELLPGPQFRIKVAGTPIYFADESPGIQVCIEGELAPAVARKLADEVLENLERVTGQHGEVIEL